MSSSSQENLANILCKICFFFSVEKYGEVIQKQKKEIQDLRDRVESLVQFRTDFTRYLIVVYFRVFNSSN